MIDLKNTYIETKDKELVTAYLEECERQGVWWVGGQVATDIVGALGLTISCNGLWINNDFTSKAPSNYKQITLADLKPKRTKESTAVDTLEQLGYKWNGGELWKPPVGEAPDYIKPKKTKVEYVKCEFSSFSEAYQAIIDDGDMFYVGGADGDTFCASDYGFSSDICLKALMSNYPKLCRKVEREVSWQGELEELLGGGIDVTVRELVADNGELAIKMCHLIASMTDKPE